MNAGTEVYKPDNDIRVVTATSLFDGHDAAINIMRRILQGTGVEVIHLGHNRSVLEIVDAAIEEDVQGVAVSSYQGGHVEFFKYMIDLLREKGAPHVKVFGGGRIVVVVAGKLSFELPNTSLIECYACIGEVLLGELGYPIRIRNGFEWGIGRLIVWVGERQPDCASGQQRPEFDRKIIDGKRGRSGESTEIR